MKAWIIIIIAIVSIGLAAGTFFLYRAHFPGDWVNERTDWGTFGDFFGGVLNPLLGLINIFVLMYISVEVAKLDERWNEKSLQKQKEFALYELKHQALTGVVEIIDTIYKTATKPVPSTVYELSNYRNQLTSFLTVHTYLCDRFNTAITPFSESIQTLIASSLLFNQSGMKGWEGIAGIELNHGEYLLNFLNLKDELVLNTQADFGFRNTSIEQENTSTRSIWGFMIEWKFKIEQLQKS